MQHSTIFQLYRGGQFYWWTLERCDFDQIEIYGIHCFFFSNAFPMQIYELTKKEIARSGDPNKLMASADV